MEILNDTFRDLKKALDISDLRNRVISENIANSETPGYKGREVDFQKMMNDVNGSTGLVMIKTNRMHIDPAGGETGIRIDMSDNPSRVDGNNVDQNVEMARLSENTIIYNTAAEILGRKLKLLKFAIEEGR